MTRDDGPFFHGTTATLQPREVLTAGFPSNYRPEIVMNHVYFTALRGGAGPAAEIVEELASGAATPHVYRVEPTGEYENDPNVTDKKFPATPPARPARPSRCGSSKRCTTGLASRRRRSRSGVSA